MMSDDSGSDAESVYSSAGSTLEELLTSKEFCQMLEEAHSELRLDAEELRDIAKVHPNFLASLNDILLHCISRGLVDVVTHLLWLFPEDIDINQQSTELPGGNTPLTAASRLPDSMELLKLLLDHGADIWRSRTACDESALDLVCEIGNMASLKLLLDQVLRRDPEDDDRSRLLYYALCSAAFSGWEEMLKMFVRRGVDINLNLDDDLGTALHRSIEAGNLGCVRTLLDAGADTETLRGCVQQTPLMRAAEYGFVTIINRLLRHGVQVNKMTEECSTALTIACHYGHTDCVKSLIAHGADVHVRNPWGFTPLFMGTDTPEIVQVLVDTGVDIDELCGERGEAAIHLASVIGSKETVKLLLDKGSNINILTYYQETPLWLAAWKGHVTVCRLLVQRNCQLNVPSNGCQVYAYDYMPVEIAMGLGHFQILRMLLLAGCSLRNELYFAEDQSGPVSEIHWVRLRGELLLGLLHSHPEQFDWFRDFVTKPRCLKHICRLKLRDILGTPLEKKCQQLEIPRELIAYLCFSEM